MSCSIIWGDGVKVDSEAERLRKIAKMVLFCTRARAVKVIGGIKPQSCKVPACPTYCRCVPLSGLLPSVIRIPVSLSEAQSSFLLLYSYFNNHNHQLRNVHHSTNLSLAPIHCPRTVITMHT
ncbi:hypothetical protein MRB53_038443 [Persea americana]|nr:hypothetical protein MRB53_038443 [Persea americana]